MKTKPAHKQPRVTRHRVFIVDDHPMTRYGLACLLNDQPDLQVCGEAENAQEALGAIQRAAPELVLMDITLPGKDGLDLVKELQLLHPGLPLLVLSMHDENIYAERLLRAGARGYIMKSEGGEKVLEAVREVLEGRVYFSRKVSAVILESLAHRQSDPDEARPGALSDREFEVFQLLGQGLSTREIAGRLHLSIKTVGVHRMHIKRKLRLRTGAELTRQAVRWAAAQQLV